MAVMSTMSTSQRVLGIPELLQSIFHFTGISSGARLARTSRHMFNAVAPLLWRDLDGAHILLALLPGTDIDLTDDGNTITIRLPRSLNDTDLRRFKIYAPFVRSLEVFGSDFTRYNMVNWGWLLEHSEQHPLLPNLRSLTLDMKEHWTGEENTRLHWLLLFISPSLTSFITPTSDSYEPRLMARNISVCVQTVLSQRCPDIQTLQLFPIHDDIMSEKDHAIFSRLVDPSIYMNVSLLFTESFRSLTHLTTSMSVANHVGLKIFGSLPAIKRLDLCFEVLAPGKARAADLDLDAFPALTALYLWNLSCLEDFATLWSMAPLTRKLTTAGVHVKQLDWDRDEHLTPIDEAARILYEHTPLISDLQLQLPGPGDSVEVAKEGLALLSKLPLERLVLLTKIVPRGFHRALSAGLFPLLKHLTLGEIIHSPNLIYYAASMPALRDLLAVIVFTDPKGIEEDVLGRAGAMTICCHALSRRDRSVLPSGNAAIAKSLHSAWSELELDTSRCEEKAQSDLKPIQDLLQSYQNN